MILESRYHGKRMKKEKRNKDERAEEVNVWEGIGKVMNHDALEEE